jgi:serine/threonine protein kinase
MVPARMLDQASDQHRLQFFERQNRGVGEEWTVRQARTASSSSSRSSSQQQQQQPKQIVVPSRDPVASLTEVICSETHRKKKFPPTEARNTAHNYEMFIDLIHRMLAYDPEQRIKPTEALNHPFITYSDQSQQHSSSPSYGASTSVQR